VTSEPEAKPNGPRLWFSKAKPLRLIVEGVALGSVANFSILCAAVRSQIGCGAKAFAFKATIDLAFSWANRSALELPRLELSVTR
jgi:hypothetical protein